MFGGDGIKLQRPIVGLVVAVAIKRAQVVHDVATAHNQNALVPQLLQLLP